MAFVPQKSANLTGMEFAHVLNRSVGADLAPVDLNIILSRSRDGSQALASGELASAFDWGSEQRGAEQKYFFTIPAALKQGETYYLILRPDEGISLDFAGSMALQFSNADGDFQQALAEPMGALREGLSYTAHFDSRDGGTLNSVSLPWVVDWEQYPEAKTLRLKVIQPDASEQVIGQAELMSAFALKDDPRGESYQVTFEKPVDLAPGRQYLVQVEFVEGPGAIALYGSTQAKESSWDDPLPVGLYGLSPYDYNQGLFRTELNFEMYWDDNAEKLKRFIGNLDQADYLFISSNRQWGTTTRVPERYPLTSYYYRNLLGCPEDKDVLWCYRVAEPGMFEGELGFTLVKVVQSDPNLGSFKINTQFAEEAFTVYDHPKVLIFQKWPDYNPDAVRSMLSSVDLSTVVHVTPKQAGKNPGSLLLPEDRLAQQRAGGTWSDLFHSDALFNRWPWLAAVLWYVTITLLGWAVLPLVTLGLGSLPDKGYPFARLVGMLLAAYLTWMIGSAGISVTRTTISLVLLLLLAGNGLLFWKQKIDLRQVWQSNRRYILIAEGIFLAFFLIDLFIRLGNPDLWHPYKGGEKPMDFSYFQAVLKSTTFPPYDPWFAGGYINYYYYGFVVVGVLVKWLGIEPSIAYNLILPTLFAFVGVGAFSIGWNLFAGQVRTLRRPFGKATDAMESDPPGQDQELVLENELSEVQLVVEYQEEEPSLPGEDKFKPLFAGLSASLAMLILGNLGTVRMIIQGFQRMAAPGGSPDAGNLFQRWGWFFQGIGRFIQGSPLPYPPGDWYWIPSRAIPGNVITEFPFFTFLYADLHAHMIALPITLLGLAWVLSILKGRWKWQAQGNLPTWVHFGTTFLLGALALGALRPTNTWDFPTYLLIGALAVIYTFVRHGMAEFKEQGSLKLLWKLLFILVVMGILTWGLYQPFGKWYGAGYTSIMRWTIDEHTPVGSYLVHWGLFFFVIVTWLVWETLDWMAKTPVSHLNKLRKYLGVIYGGLALLAGLTILLLALGASIAWLALPLAAWAGILLLRPGQPDEKRLVLFLVGSGLVLTLFVEVFVLEGDIGRMNTVFKFYLQAWTMFAISAAAGLMWMLADILANWTQTAWRVWRVVLGTLVFGAALFPLLAGADKIGDRMSSTASHTLDGMVYMQSSIYSDQGKDMNLDQDYQAIQWMLENVEGSPVIAEANTPEYRWGSRFTINTGLPGVVGWNWHQRQQRSVVTSEWVTTRVEAITSFYTTSDRNEVEDFLRRYDVKYIVVGQLEQAFYPGPGLEKFEEWDGDLWQSVYRQDETVIYQTLLDGQ
jgi:YYY domain-containing protein